MIQILLWRGSYCYDNILVLAQLTPLWMWTPTEDMLASRPPTVPVMEMPEEDSSTMTVPVMSAANVPVSKRVGEGSVKEREGRTSKSSGGVG